MMSQVLVIRLLRPRLVTSSRHGYGDCARLANYAAGIVVGKLGTASLTLGRTTYCSVEARGVWGGVSEMRWFVQTSLCLYDITLRATYDGPTVASLNCRQAALSELPLL